MPKSSLFDVLRAFAWLQGSNLIIALTLAWPLAWCWNQSVPMVTSLPAISGIQVFAALFGVSLIATFVRLVAITTELIDVAAGRGGAAARG